MFELLHERIFYSILLQNLLQILLCLVISLGQFGNLLNIIGNYMNFWKRHFIKKTFYKLHKNYQANCFVIILFCKIFTVRFVKFTQKKKLVTEARICMW